MLCLESSGEKAYILISRVVTGTALNCPWDIPFWIWLPGTSHDWYYNWLLWWGNILDPGIIHRTRFLNIHIAAGQANGTRPINFPTQNMSFISNPNPYCRKNQYSQRRPSGKWIRGNVALPLFFLSAPNRVFAIPCRLNPNTWINKRQETWIRTSLHTDLHNQSVKTRSTSPCRLINDKNNWLKTIINHVWNKNETDIRTYIHCARHSPGFRCSGSKWWQRKHPSFNRTL